MRVGAIFMGELNGVFGFKLGGDRILPIALNKQLPILYFFRLT
jgi:hypothetical protein